jgi:endonuclease/exonuclease/phosphatase family metal-dependent hydrolase
VVESPGKIWRFTGIYGEPRWQDKYKTWDKFNELKNDYDLPWVILGNFNEILFSHEKEGGNRRSQSYMLAFQNALTDCDLDDMGFSGDPFTWKRGRIRERLDHVICNGSWVMTHPMARVHHLAYIRYHLPILLDTEYLEPYVPV